MITNFLTQNDCYKTNRNIKVKGLMIHSVGCPQPSAQVFVKSWNRSGLKTCVHAFIDGNTGVVYQTLPWNHRGWHGGGSCNDTHIGVELCEPSTIRYTGGSSFKDLDPASTKKVVLRTYSAAVKLFAHLCKEYNLNPLTDIVSHKEGHALGIASNHGDPEHLWKSFGLYMNGFRTAVKAEMEKGVNTPITNEKANSDVPAASYKVKVTVDSLNIRKGAGINFPVVGCIKNKGVYTIIEEKNDWGKLKSGAGWIRLKYTKKI